MTSALLSSAPITIKYENFLMIQVFQSIFTFPVSKSSPETKLLPLKTLSLFLECPRVDWLKSNTLNFDELDAYGIEYDRSLKKQQVSASKVDSFKCLDPWFEQVCPEEAKLIYEKMFEALADEPEEELEKLVFRTYEVLTLSLELSNSARTSTKHLKMAKLFFISFVNLT